MVNILTNKKLALVFSKGVSLADWVRIGVIDREVKFYKYLTKHFQKVSFFTYDKEDKKFQLPGITVRANQWTELIEADIIKTNQMNGSPLALLVKLIWKKKLVVRCGYQLSLFAKQENYSVFRRFLIFLLEAVSYKSADAIIVTSKEAKEFVKRRYKPKACVHLIPNYVDTDLFRPINANKGKDEIVFVGRLSREKNLFNLIEAVANAGVNLTIFGGGQLEYELKEFVKEKKARVTFRGNIMNSSLPEEMNRFSAFILPSFHEGNPKVLLEAMSCGIPVIGTNVQGIREIIKDKVNGLLCNTTIASIQKSIETVLDPKFPRESMGRKARSYIISNNSLRKVVKKELSVYEGLR